MAGASGTSQVCLDSLVDLVCFVDLVHLVSFVQPKSQTNQIDQMNKRRDWNYCLGGENGGILDFPAFSGHL
jgi:hypothetical protein